MRRLVPWLLVLTGLLVAWIPWLGLGFCLLALVVARKFGAGPWANALAAVGVGLGALYTFLFLWLPTGSVAKDDPTLQAFERSFEETERGDAGSEGATP